MKAAGRLQRLLWRARLKLRTSALARSIAERVRKLAPDTRPRHLRGEVGFWRRWLQSGGLGWPEDYAFRLDPRAPIQEHLARIIESIPQSRVEILDVGSGPLTVIGKVHPTKRLSITATDVLGSEYDALLGKLGIEPPVRPIAAEAERLRDTLGGRSFDLVHAQNALDHCADPFAAINEMVAVTRPGGFIVLLHEENEGEKERYHALHKWNFANEGGRFVIRGPGPGGPARDVTTMLESCAEVECSYLGDELLVTIRKVDAAKSG
jgi:SAM-dependent methyltransferase